MLLRYKNRAKVGGAIFGASVGAVVLLGLISEDIRHGPIGAILFWIGGFAYWFAVYSVAKAKGYWGLLGVFLGALFVVGLVILWLLADKHPESGVRATTNRTGWLRLGAALSAVWLLFVLGVALYEYSFGEPSDSLWFVTYVPGSLPDPKSPNIVWDVPSLKPWRLALWTFAPLAGAWVLFPLAIWAVSWVRAGFKS